ncbi:hypothetical protein ABZS61_32100 [Streptomyces sp. NPDC005566]|uniref:hypothetical protein n=1 Tax=Streptomyces sp. NPDC005566 TaxID=3156886 RepID=UPI00339F4319
MKKKIAVAIAATALTLFANASPASADVVRNEGFVAIRTSAGYELCVGVMEGRDPFDSNSDQKARFKAYAGTGCQGWLERKRYNADGSVQYNWTKVSDYYWFSDGQAWKETGFHWNGTNAGSRVCVLDTSVGKKECSTGVW